MSVPFQGDSARSTHWPFQAGPIRAHGVAKTDQTIILLLVVDNDLIIIILLLLLLYFAGVAVTVNHLPRYQRNTYNSIMTLL